MTNMDDGARTIGSVVIQVGALELLARYSMNSGRATSVLSSIHEFRMQEVESSGGKQWNWKYLRDQFDQKDLEGLYRKYDDKLKETLIHIYLSLLVVFSTIHIIMVAVGTYFEEVQSLSTYLAFGMYILRIGIPIMSLWRRLYNPLTAKWFWMPIMITIIITIDIVFTDIAISIYSFSEGISLRPAYTTIALLSIYVFLPMRNNFVAILIGIIVSTVYVLIFAFFTYDNSPNLGVVIAADIIYLIGVNLMGVYFRLMNEIITRRSFLDRRACVESTLRLKFVKDQEERLMMSILPEHIVSKVRQDIRTMFLGLQTHTMSHTMRSFKLEGFKWYTWLIFGSLILALIVLQPFIWFQFLWTKYKGFEEPRDKRLRCLYDISAKIIKSAMIRTILYVLISVGLAATSVVNVIGCTEVEVEPSVTETVLSNCVSSWHVTQCWGLALLLNFLFSRVFFIFKWIVAGGMTAFYLWIVWEIKSSLFAIDTAWNVGMDPRVSHTLSVVFVMITLYWIDRTTEYRNRLDHLWQLQLREEQQEAETMLKVNNMLLENILPAHVVQVYLNLHRSIDELYYEKYDNVAVMFASLTDYKLGLESDADVDDKFMLSILDEVISDFDRLLLTGTSVYKVEKIKMAGWTYMAACGLDPNRRESFGSSSYNSNPRQNNPYNRAVTVTMVEFAAAMMMQLQTFNRGSFQSFEGLNLRIGISHGEVAAGVVGSLKPLYDIWGHAVNMASRMDSTGETGKIQVTENTAIILDECDILTTYRGETFVKGAGYIKTYFVPLDENFNLIKKQQSMEYYRVQDRTRYFNIRNTLFNETYNSNTSFNDALDSESQASTYGIRNLSEDESDSEVDSRTVTPIPRDDMSTMSTSSESVRDTWC